MVGPVRTNLVMLLICQAEEVWSEGKDS